MYEKLDDIILKKRAIEKKLNEVFSKYYDKYLKKIYTGVLGMPNVNRNFQKELLYIANWDSERLQKEYRQFVKWCHTKREIDQSRLETWVKKYIINSNKILLYPKNTNLAEENSNYTDVTCKFFYRCLKKIAKQFYENPDTYTQSDENTHMISEFIKETITFQLVSLLSLNDTLLTDEQDFNNINEDHIENDIRNSTNQNDSEQHSELNSGNNKSHDSLNYIPTDIFEKYSVQESVKSNNSVKSIQSEEHQKKSDKSSHDDEVRHIVLQTKPRFNDIMAITNVNKQQKRDEFFSES